jgi:aspartyl protease
VADRVPGGDTVLAEVGFRLAGAENPLILIPTRANGRGPYEFILDTGASATVLSPELAAALRLDTVAAGPMTGAGGIVQATLGRVGSLTVGSAALQDVAVMVGDFLAELGQVVGTQLDGILGYNFLRHFRVAHDFPNGVLWLIEERVAAFRRAGVRGGVSPRRSGCGNFHCSVT